MVKEDSAQWNFMVRTVEIRILKVTVLNICSMVAKDAFVSKGMPCDCMCIIADKNSHNGKKSQYTMLPVPRQTKECVQYEEYRLHNENRKRQAGHCSGYCGF